MTDRDLFHRAARLARIPGVTLAEVCARTGISRSDLRRARAQTDLSEHPWRRDLVLAGLTDTGRRTEGPWPSAEQHATLASYLDFVNKDGSTPQHVADLLDELVREGILARSDAGFRLLVPFP